ncbi:hypothetical protein CDEF62S_04066 [Castellaniella defragrans]|uniref:Cthe-2314-like HEPN domain-containing protein n=2 Tax=Burkholderiales TaxID=80840 RepID=A0A366H6W8_9BURK|nr:hypothetical protein DFR37_110112 [Eoetvoesiella caeni]
MPHLKIYARKGLNALQSGSKTFPGPAVEIYAADVTERVSELDNALTALRLALGFVMDLGSQSALDPDIYRYHYENFVLRVVGFVDRAHRLVGSALLMDKAKFESVGGNRFVTKQVKTNYPDIHAALQGVTQAVESYKGPRNELIHSAAYTSRELGLFQSIRHFGLDTGDIDVDELARGYFSGGATEIALTIARLVKTLANLLDALHPLFLIAVDHDNEHLKKKSAPEGTDKS